MEPLSGVTSAAYPSGPIAIHGSACLLRARDVAVVFKERRYDNGAPKTWYFAHIDQVARIYGCVQLLRKGYGAVFDVPDEEVERVYTITRTGLYPASTPRRCGQGDSGPGERRAAPGGARV